MATATFEITTINGKKVEITKTTNTFETANIVDHNFSNGKMTIVKFSANINGKVLPLELKRVCDFHEGKTVEMCRAAGVKFYFKNLDTGCVIIPTADSVKSISVSDDKNDYDDDYDDMMQEFAETAKNILTNAKTTIKNADGTYMTAEQAADYTKNYNDFYNESGEGFVPYIITQEAVDWAQKIIAKTTSVKNKKERIDFMKTITENLKKAIAYIINTEYKILEREKKYKIVHYAWFDVNQFACTFIYRKKFIDFTLDGDVVSVCERNFNSYGDIWYTELGEYRTL